MEYNNWGEIFCRDGVPIENFGTICRVCLQSNNLLSFIPQEVANIFEKITNIQVKMNEELPENICQDCIKQLKDINQFIEKCKNNHCILMQKLEMKGQIEQVSDEHFDNETISEQGVLKLENDTSQHSDAEAMEPDELKRRRFECAKCNANFSLKLSLVNHLEKHAEKSFRSHKKITTISRYKLNGKRKGVLRSKLENNLLVEPKSKYYCSQCDRVLTSRSALTSHMKTHTGERPYSCLYCGKSFSYISSLTVHTRLHTGETPYVCPICNKGYRSSTSLKKHREVKHFEIDASLNHGTEITQEKMEKVNESSKQECKICHKILNKYGFGTHMRIHTVGKKEFKCTFCDKQFQKNSHLERHVRIHTGERPYECKLCNKTFVQDGDLKRHVSIHSGEKQFQCQHCGKQYFTKGALATHMSIHEDAKNPSNPHCSVCKKTVDHCDDYKTHMNAHAECKRKYLCTVCGKSFTASGSLKVHTRIHTGETPFMCLSCNKAFNNSSALKRHVIRNHTEDKTHICMVCHKSFHDSSNLKRHVRRVHSVVEMKSNREVPLLPNK